MIETTEAILPLPAPVGLAGYGIPDLRSGYSRREVRTIHAWSDEIIDESGIDNIVVADGDGANKMVFFQLPGSHSNSVVYEDGPQLHARISITGSNNRVIIRGGSPWPSELYVYLNGNNSTLFVGKGCTFNHTTMFVTGDNVSVICGEDCMFAHATMIRTYDQHAVIDLETGTWINEPQSVLIGPHVWVGQECLILKGSKIGQGSILGARSTVTGDIPSAALAVGTPARAVRTGVGWLRESHPGPDAAEQLRAAMARFGREDRP